MDVTADLHSIRQLTCHAAHHAQQQCLLDILVSKDLGRQAGRQSVIHVATLSNLLHNPQSLSTKARLVCWTDDKPSPRTWEYLNI